MWALWEWVSRSFKSFRFPGYISYWFSKPGVWGTVSHTGCKNLGDRCGTRISCSSGRVFAPLWFFPVVGFPCWDPFSASPTHVHAALCLLLWRLFIWFSESCQRNYFARSLGRRWVQALPTWPSWSCRSRFFISCAVARQAGSTGG